MIDRLHVMNVALIEKVDLEFTQGLNILSGETGAGKSILIDSINFLLGQKAGKDFIRSGSEQAVVEGMVVLNNAETLGRIQALGVDIEDDNALLISRTLSSNGKSVIRINGRQATVGMLKEISALLIDIHGQHQHQSLLNPARHMELLDKFCGNEMESLQGLLSERIKSYRETLRQITAISGTDRDLQSKLDYLSYQIDEIEEAALKPGEEEELIAARRILLGAERLIENTGQILGLLYGGGEEDSALDKLYKAEALFAQMVDTDPSLQAYLNALGGVTAELDDITRDIRRYGENLEYNPEALELTEKRLDLIYSLKRKYGSSVADILQFLEKVREEHEMLLNSGALLTKLNKQGDKLYKEILKICGEITKLRKKQGAAIEKKIELNLKELGMKDAVFEISITERDEFTANGKDKVEFLISANRGEPVKPLSKIASGGEMSRVMLAMKTVLAHADNIDTFIFDEIDTGVSGRTAQKVAEKLSGIAIGRQILCITHLPQIAAMADSHYLIEKYSEKDRTSTRVSGLDKAGVEQELARLIGGAEITEATLAAAGEIKSMADAFKEKMKKGM